MDAVSDESPDVDSAGVYFVTVEEFENRKPSDGASELPPGERPTRARENRLPEPTHSQKVPRPLHGSSFLLTVRFEIISPLAIAARTLGSASAYGQTHDGKLGRLRDQERQRQERGRLSRPTGHSVRPHLSGGLLVQFPRGVQ